jgi:hypothetical protein
MATTAGYSGTPLPKKLGIKPGMAFAAVAAPPELAEVLVPLPDGARQLTWPANVELVVAFFVERADLVRRWPELTAAVGTGGTVWVAWPKRSSGVPTDITEDALRELLLPSGWVDVKVCAIDTTWSGLKFVLRKELR